MDLHISSVHEQKTLFKCDSCSSKFSSNQGLKYYKESNHEEKKLLANQFSNQNMVSKGISNRFIKKSKQTNKYNISVNIFITKGSIMIHITLHGKEDKSFKYVKCDSLAFHQIVKLK